MAWNTVSYANIDIRDGQIHEIYLTGYEALDLDQKDADGDSRSAHKYYGAKHHVGPVAFLATDLLFNSIGVDFPKLIRVKWQGKAAMKDGRTVNIFACESFQPEGGETFPAWTQGSSLEVLPAPIRPQSAPIPAKDAPLPDAGAGPVYQEGEAPA